MSARSLPVLSVLCLLVANEATAQPILVGCSYYPPGSPTSSWLFDLDRSTGLATNPRGIGINALAGIATQPSTGILYGLTSRVSNPASTLITIDSATGSPTVVGPTGLPFLTEGDLAFHPTNGFLYGINDAGTDLLHRNLFRINPATGAATVIASLGTTGDYSALAFDAAGMLYTIDDRPGNLSNANAVLRVVDPNTGAIVNSVTTNMRLGLAAGMTIDYSTGTVYVADGGDSAGANNSLFTLDVVTGQLTLVGSLGYPGGVSGLAMVSVPEPSSWLLGSLAAAALIGAKSASARHVAVKKK